MFLRVCRRVLHNETDAEDAFQATFLVLARKAASIKRPALLGNWLYGVAYRTALKARTMNRRRRLKEHEAWALPLPEGVDESLQMRLSELDRELNGLPDLCRIPIVLCDLEGQQIISSSSQKRRAADTQF